MQPYDWCNPGCPNPCTCMEAIMAKVDRERENEARPCCGDPADCQENCKAEFPEHWE